MYSVAAGSGPFNIRPGEYTMKVELTDGQRTRMDLLTLNYQGPSSPTF